MTIYPCPTCGSGLSLRNATGANIADPADIARAAAENERREKLEAARIGELEARIAELEVHLIQQAEIMRDDHNRLCAGRE